MIPSGVVPDKASNAMDLVREPVAVEIDHARRVVVVLEPHRPAGGAVQQRHLMVGLGELPPQVEAEAVGIKPLVKAHAQPGVHDGARAPLALEGSEGIEGFEEASGPFESDARACVSPPDNPPSDPSDPSIPSEIAESLTFSLVGSEGSEGCSC